MNKKFVLTLAVGLIVLVAGIGLTPCAVQWVKVRRWTTQYSASLAEAIIRFETVTTDWQAFQQQDQSTFAEVATGSALSMRRITQRRSPNIDTHVAIDKIEFKQLKVISYTESSAYVDSIVRRWTTRHWLAIEKIEVGGGGSFWTIYHLERENGVWKVEAFVTCSTKKPEKRPCISIEDLQ